MQLPQWMLPTMTGACAVIPTILRGLILAYDGIPDRLDLATSPHIWAAYEATLRTHSIWACITLLVTVGIVAIWARRKSYGPWMRFIAVAPWAIFGGFENIYALASAWYRAFDYD